MASVPARIAVTTAVSATAVFAAMVITQPAPARIVRPLDWADRGVWIEADLHAHTRFSDGSPIEQVVGNAVAHGCQALAITDHSDEDLRALTPEYFEALAAMRKRFPDLLLLGGFEWNVPPGKGQDHVSVLLPAAREDPAAFEGFGQRFDDLHKHGENPSLADEALRWLTGPARGPAPAPVLILNHPSRRAATPRHALELFTRLRSVSSNVVGFEGAPGHQKAAPIGSYSGPLQLIDRWDPVVAEVGGTWDRLLGEGQDVTGALATSDFHGVNDGDYWPCEFAETWIYAPERSTEGVLRALRAGSFFGVHGGIARAVHLSAGAKGLERPLVAGETGRIPAGTLVTIELRFDAPSHDWSGAPNRVERVEVITTDSRGSTVAWSGAPVVAGVPQVRVELEIPAGGVVVRARGRRIVPDGPDLLFYTNAIRIVT